MKLEELYQPDGMAAIDELVRTCEFTAGGFRIVSVISTFAWPTDDAIVVVTLWVEDEARDEDGRAKTPQPNQSVLDTTRYFTQTWILEDE